MLTALCLKDLTVIGVLKSNHQHKPSSNHPQVIKINITFSCVVIVCYNTLIHSHLTSTMGTYQNALIHTPSLKVDLT